MEIIVNVLPDCKLAKITGGGPNDVVKYDISSKVEVTISPPSFQTDYAYCNTLLTYTLFDLDNLNVTADPLVFTLAAGPLIKLKTVDKTKVRTYRLGLKAMSLTASKTVLLTVNIIDQCPSATLEPHVIPDYSYNLGDEQAIII
jgi:hypothetical protein